MNIVIRFMTIRPYNSLKTYLEKINRFMKLTRGQRTYACTYMLWTHCCFPFSIQLVLHPMEDRLYWLSFVPFHCSTTNNDSDHVTKSYTLQTNNSMIYDEVLSLLGQHQPTCLKSKSKSNLRFFLCDKNLTFFFKKKLLKTVTLGTKIRAED